MSGCQNNLFSAVYLTFQYIWAFLLARGLRNPHRNMSRGFPNTSLRCDLFTNLLTSCCSWEILIQLQNWKFWCKTETFDAKLELWNKTGTLVQTGTLMQNWNFGAKLELLCKTAIRVLCQICQIISLECWEHCLDKLTRIRSRSKFLSNLFEGSFESAQLGLD